LLCVIQIWRKSSSKYTLDGRRVEFRCTGGKYRIADCPASVYLLYHADSYDVSLFKTEADHGNHNAEPSRGLPAGLKVFVTKKFNDGLTKPNAILNVIRERNMTEPPKSKLVNFLQQLRAEKYGPPTIYAKDLSEWCDVRRPSTILRG